MRARVTRQIWTGIRRTAVLATAQTGSMYNERFDMLKRLFVLLLIALVIPTAAAQDADPATCPAPDALLASITTLLTESQGMDTLTILDALRIAVSEHTIACTGLVFTSDEYGMQPVIGPFSVPAGVYRMTLTTTGFLTSSFDLLTGDCDTMFANFLVTGDEATEGVQKVFESEGCEVLLSVSNTREPWTLEFEKLR